jgi:hypothetical protein
MMATALTHGMSVTLASPTRSVGLKCVVMYCLKNRLLLVQFVEQPVSSSMQVRNRSHIRCRFVGDFRLSIELLERDSDFF